MAHVFLVEDDRDSRQMLAVYLRGLGHRVTEAECGQAALRKLLDEQPDVLVMDLRMPDLDGFALLEIMRSYLRWHDLPVIVVTGLATDEERWRLSQLSVSHVFEKSKFHLPELAATIEALAGRK